MYNYNNLLEKLKIDNTSNNRKYLKAIIHALLINNDAEVMKQLIKVEFDKVEYLYLVLNELKLFFDYRYNTKIDLTRFFSYILSGKSININAIFCPGYTSSGYKNYVGNNTTTRMETLNILSDKFDEMNISVDFKIILANVFLENTDDIKNSNWKRELVEHEKIFYEVGCKYFDIEDIIKLSDVFPSDEYIKGFIIDESCHGKVYDNFYKNNIEFYKRMGWDDKQIQYRNDKLYTIYRIISRYINEQKNGIYIPMETMYSRSKVMTDNGVCTMYLIKK